MPIPPSYDRDWCWGHGKDEPQHKNGRECFLATWNEAPMRWVKRTGPATFYSTTGGRVWHLVIGIRKAPPGVGDVQTECSVGGGPGPFIWREKPDLNGHGFCKRCLAAWTKEVESVTVRADPIRVTRKQLEGLLTEMPNGPTATAEIRPTSVDNTPALVASWSTGDRDDTYVKYLLVGDGLVKLGYESDRP